MEWTPEIFAGFVTAGGGALYALKRIGWLELAWTRNSKPKVEPSTHEARAECVSKHDEFRSSIDQLENDRTELKTMSQEHEKRLDKQDLKYEKIMDGISLINANVAVLAAAEKRRNGTPR